MGKPTTGSVNAPTLDTPNIMPFVNNGVQSEEGNLFADKGMFNSTSRVLGQAGMQQKGLADQAALANQTQMANATMQQQADAINNANTNALISGIGSFLPFL